MDPPAAQNYSDLLVGMPWGPCETRGFALRSFNITLNGQAQFQLVLIRAIEVLWAQRDRTAKRTPNKH